MTHRSQLWIAGVLALLLGVSTSATAATFTLADLVGGNVTFESDNGLLTFSDFSVTKLKKLDGNLSLYTITTVNDGFVLTSSALTANSGGLKKLNLTYTVTADAGYLITAAEMEMDASRSTGRVKVEKDIEEANGGDEGTFLLTLLRNNNSLLIDSDVFDNGAISFDVEEAIRIKKVSTLNSVRNSYTAVPEPAELSMLAAGLIGLAALGRRRSASRA